MAQNFALPSYSDNPSGIGNTMFTEAPDLLSVHLGNLKMFDDGVQRRKADQQQKQQATAEMFKGLKLDQQGILETDVPHFQERINKMNDFLTQGMKAGYDPTKPGAGAFYNTYKNMYDQVQQDMKTSAAEREWLVNQNKLAIEKGGDLEKTADKTYMFSSLPFDKRNHKLPQVYTAKTPELLTLTKEKVMKDIPTSSESKTVKDPITGGFVTEKISTYTPQQISGMATAGYRGNSEITESVDEMFKGLDQNKRDALTQQAQALSKGGNNVSPQELFYSEYINSLNSKKEEQSGITFTPAQRAYWNNFYKDDDDEEYVKYIAEAVGKANSDDAEFWGEGVDNGIVAPVAGTVKSVFGINTPDPTKTYYSNALNNLPLGNVAIPTKKQDGTIDYQSIPNRVLGMKKENGKTYIQTDESFELHRNDPSEPQWTELNDRTIDKLVLGSKNPIKAAGILRKTLTNMGAYPNQNVKLGTKTTTKQLTKKLSSGRQVFSDDGGKTWHP